ncbi:MAG: hypothetical protein ACQEUB_14135 [Thermodesulfobacteriota bacterium]
MAQTFLGLFRLEISPATKTATQIGFGMTGGIDRNNQEFQLFLRIWRPSLQSAWKWPPWSGYERNGRSILEQGQNIGHGRGWNLGLISHKSSQFILEMASFEYVSTTT